MKISQQRKTLIQLKLEIKLRAKEREESIDDVTVHVVVRTFWYKEDAKRVIIDQEADVLTSLYYHNHFSKNYFDENNSPNVYTLVDFPIPAYMKKIIKYIHYEELEYANTYYATSTYREDMSRRSEFRSYSLSSLACRTDVVQINKIVFTDRSAKKVKIF